MYRELCNNLLPNSPQTLATHKVVTSKPISFISTRKRLELLIYPTREKYKVSKGLCSLCNKSR